VLDPGDQAERQGDGHRIVAAGLGLERACEPAADVRRPERREHGRRVGRCDDGPEEQRLEPREVEESPGTHARHERAHDHADRAEEGCRDRGLPQPAPGRLETALVQDQAEADDSDSSRELLVVKVDAAGAVRAEQHPEPEERDEHGKAGARRT
jgi:hypothetical protein